MAVRGAAGPIVSALNYHEFLHADGKGGGIQQNLPVLVQEADDVLDEHHKVLGEQLIGLDTRKE